MDSSETVVQLRPFGHHLLSSDSGQCSDGGGDEPKQPQKQQKFQPPHSGSENFKKSRPKKNS